MTLMFVVVIPKLSRIILDSGQEVPLYTKIIIGFANFFVNYGLIIRLARVFREHFQNSGLRIERTRVRRGDNAEMARVSFVDNLSEAPVAVKAEKTAAPTATAAKKAPAKKEAK
jgi:hypothetical protein